MNSADAVLGDTARLLQEIEQLVAERGQTEMFKDILTKWRDMIALSRSLHSREFREDPSRLPFFNQMRNAVAMVKSTIIATPQEK